MRLVCTLAIVALVLAACRNPQGTSASERSSAGPERSAPTPTPPRTADRTGLPALAAAWLERLEPAGGYSAYVAVPVGAREPRPVLVAVHGAGDRPDWACGGWRIAAEAYPFVVCPQGSPMAADRFGWPSSNAILRAIDAAVAGVRSRFGRYVDDGSMIYAGFSQGATLARPVLLARASAFPIAILAEGGYGFLADDAFAQRYSEQGGKRVMIVCGGSGCFGHALRAERVLARAGLEVILSGDPTSGHNLNEPMQRALRKSWPALTADQAAWSPYSGHRWPK